MSAVYPVQNLSGVRCGPYQPGLRADSADMILIFEKCGKLDDAMVNALRVNGFEPHKSGYRGSPSDWIKRWPLKLQQDFWSILDDAALKVEIIRAVKRTLAALNESIAAAKPEPEKLD